MYLCVMSLAWPCLHRPRGDALGQPVIPLLSSLDFRVPTVTQLYLLRAQGPSSYISFSFFLFFKKHNSKEAFILLFGEAAILVRYCPHGVYFL